MRYDGAKYTSYTASATPLLNTDRGKPTSVSTSKRDGSLSASTILRFGFRHIAVDHLDNGLKRSEFHHGVWDLTAPERVQALVEAFARINYQYRLFPLKKSVAYPAVPSLAVIVDSPLKVPDANGGIVVCIRTLTASNGQRAMSAKNSAEALAVKYKEVLYRYAMSSPARSE